MTNRLILAATVALITALPLTNAEAARAVFNTGDDYDAKHRDLSTDIRPGAHNDTRIWLDDRENRRHYRNERADYIDENGDVVVYDARRDRYYVYNRASDRYTARQEVVYRQVNDRRAREGQLVLLDTDNDGIVDTRARIMGPRKISATQRERAMEWTGSYPYVYVD